MNQGESTVFLELIDNVVSYNSFNEAINTPIVVHKLWATKIVKGENESFTNGQRTYRKNIQFIIQYDPIVNEKMNLKDLETNEIFRINGIRVYGHKEALELNVETIDKFN